MRKLILPIIAALFLIFSLALFVSNPTAAQEPEPPPLKSGEPLPATPPVESTPPFQIDRSLLPKIEPQLLKKLLTNSGNAAPFIVYLKTKADLSAAVAAAQADPQTPPDELARRQAVINALKQTARDSQAGVLQTLAGQGVTGQTAATDIKPLWIVNGVAAKGSLEMVLALAARPDVEIVRLDKTIKMNPAAQPGCQQAGCRPHASGQNGSLQSQSGVEWGVSKIRADLVQTALNISGTGVVVANIDTGVDWLHPALQSNYRGYTGPGKLPNHTGNWFDATGDGATYPVDTDGHGTHTMGTAVGGNGLGVAPGAGWIAVRAFDSSGSAQFSWLHSAFQWLLEPNGDPALAPDVVNNSWGNSDGSSTEFQADVQALLDAGILPIFSAGNNGPASGSVGSPGSLTIAFAVGATTSDDEIANFSSRGPSFWAQIKPDVSAPGKDVRSSLPGGAYGELNGTSMAAPHVSGLAALLLQASPSLSNNLDTLTGVMESTAVPLGSPIPNNSYGWGQIDAYSAVMSVASVGTLQGAVTDASSGNPVSTPLIQITPSLTGPTVSSTGDGSGNYIQGLAPNSYDVTASAFGYQPATVHLVEIVTHTTKTQNFSLTPKPTGFLSGSVKDKSSGAPLAATLTVEGTPAGGSTNPASGGYSLALPVGVYTVTVVAAEHRITRAVNINITAGVTTTQNFLLDSALSILLVDSGRWYQESEISYYQQTLDDALYPYDTWQITKPFETPNDIPPAATLAQYDLVIWSAPFDSPGYVGADDELATYLNGGGKLLLSGQDVAYYDAFWLFGVSYLKEQLKTAYVKDSAGVTTVDGLAGAPFAGLSLNIAGGDGADNQIFPDVIANADTDFAGSLLAYSSGSADLGGLHIGLCVPYRALYLSFGFEGINNKTDRQQVMEKAIGWLTETPAPHGLELTPATETQIGNFGATVSHTVRLRNIGSNSDTFNLTLSNLGPYNWSTGAVPASVSLPACQSQALTVDVQIPLTKSWHISDSFRLTAQSSGDPAQTQIITRSSKTPAPVLLVDDDRWFSFAHEFKAALSANNIPYDYWLVAKSWSGPVPPSPPPDTLQMYPMVVWYAAYDWFQPLTPEEEGRLIDYLDGGGRLFFSSQDFLFRHLRQHGNYDSFAQSYLGILAHTEDYSSTLTVAEASNPVGALLGPYPLNFPGFYKNWTDALTPTTTAKIFTRGQANQPNGLTNAGTGPGGQHWHTVFLAYGPELLASGHRARLMQRSVGWLSWLGSSTVEPQTPTITNNGLVTFTATVSNNGLAPIASAYFTATFPGSLTPVSASPGVNLVGGEFVWGDSLAQNEGKTFTYTAKIVGTPPLGSVISQTSWLGYDEHNIMFDRVAHLSVAPALGQSTMGVTPAQEIEENDILSYTITLKNTGLVDAPMVTTTDTLPDSLDLVAVDTPSQGSVLSGGQYITWTTALAQNQVATLTFRARVNQASGFSIKNTAYADDAFNAPVPLSAQANFKTIPFYFPIILKN